MGGFRPGTSRSRGAKSPRPVVGGEDQRAARPVSSPPAGPTLGGVKGAPPRPGAGSRKAASEGFKPDRVKVRKPQVGGLVPGGLRAVAQKQAQTARRSQATPAAPVRAPQPKPRAADHPTAATLHEAPPSEHLIADKPIVSEMPKSDVFPPADSTPAKPKRKDPKPKVAKVSKPKLPIPTPEAEAELSASQPEPVVADSLPHESLASESLTLEGMESTPQKQEQPKAEQLKAEHLQPEKPRPEQPKTEQPRIERLKPERLTLEQPKPEHLRTAQPKPDQSKLISRKPSSPSEPLRVTIEKLVQGGYGLARDGGQAIFVRGAIPGETLDVSVAQSHKQYREAAVVGIVEASADRVTPPCPVYGTCGGCHLQHIRYDAQLALKREMFLETLARVGKIELPDAAHVPPVVAASQDYGTRSVVRFAVLRQNDGLSLGFHREGSAKVIPVTDCVVLPDSLRAVVAQLSVRLAAWSRPSCRIESIELRASTSSSDVLAVLQTDARAKRQSDAVFQLMRGLPGLVGCVVQGAAEARSPRWAEGQEWVSERLDDMLIRISDRSFLQSNWSINKLLSETVVDWAAPTPGLRVLELYAGIGTLGLPLAKRGALVTLVEGNPTALADARRAAEGNHIGRCRFRPMAAEAFLPTATPGDYDLVLIDPPRTGLTPEALDGVAALKAPRLLYVSCDPATLARDLGRLRAAVSAPDRVYTIARLHTFDMFPQTAHLEALVELHRVPEPAR